MVVVAATSSAMAMTISQSAASSAKLAIELSTKANINPSFADEACDLWQSILCVDTDEVPLPLSAMSVAHGLFGMTLSRVGRDKEALVQFDSSLAFFDKCKTNEAQQQIIMTKAEADVLLAKSKSLQRLMKYRDAITVLNKLSSRCKATNAQSKEGNALRICLTESVERAALCSMRMGDVNLAIRLLEDFFETSSSGHHEAVVEGMLGACLLLEELITGSNKDRHEKAQQLIQNALQSSVSPIYNWIHHHLVACGEESFNPFDGFSKDDIYALFAEANNSPFDDPDLIFLDDKIRLHEVMKDYNTLCPVGYVLPREMDVLERDWNDEEHRGSLAWMLKDRAGYGSHGNMLARLEDVLNLVLDEEKLFQRIVHPPMILSNGCKFSLRVYVVYFPDDPDQVFISTEGLVKFASSLYSNEANNDVDDQYMTNSGRGDGRSSKQADFDFLRQEFNEKEDVDYAAMWQQIKNSVELVMNRYSTLKRQDIDGKFFNGGYISYFGLPKILGFDFILDSFANPWLLEVNRFPGLDPRGDSDMRVKHSVQYDAWITATRRIGRSPEHMKKFCPNDYKGFSLEQLCNK